MKLLKRLFIDSCPTCNKVLDTNKSKFSNSIVVKTCPDNHYQKEFHPALETYIESDKASYSRINHGSSPLDSMR